MPVRVVAVISESHSLGFYVPQAQGPCFTPLWKNARYGATPRFDGQPAHHHGVGVTFIDILTKKDILSYIILSIAVRPPPHVEPPQYGDVAGVHFFLHERLVGGTVRRPILTKNFVC